MCVGILSVLLIPIMDMLITSNRAAASARRMLDSTLYAQSLLEAMAELNPSELPDAGGGERELLDGAPASVAAPPGRWKQASNHIHSSPPFPLNKRSVKVQELFYEADGSIRTMAPQV